MSFANKFFNKTILLFVTAAVIHGNLAQQTKQHLFDRCSYNKMAVVNVRKTFKYLIVKNFIL